MAEVSEQIRIPVDTAAITLDGACFQAFIDDLAKETSEASAREVAKKAEEVVRNCVREYVGAYGEGEVGAKGGGRASSGARSSQKLNGLLYGRVQSGKTNTSIGTVALACANGFRCFVVLTSDNTWLGKQTADRFRDQLGKGDGPVVRSWDDWREDPRDFADDIRRYLEDTGVVLVSTKNGKNLENLIAVLKRLGAGCVPGMILDDEADNASLNTNAARMARGSTDLPSRIFELIGKVRDVMPSHVFVQITATPQSLLLQSLESASRPRWSVLLEPGESYVGGDVFFKQGSPYSVTVDDDLTSLRGGKISPGKSWHAPEGFAFAVCCFVTGMAIRQITTGKRDTLSMLIHIAHTKISHKAVKDTLKGYLAWLDQGLRGKLSESAGKLAEAAVQKAYKELSQTCEQMPEFEAVLEKLRSNLRNANPEIIDADNPNRKPEYHPGMNFLIGGNRLGRGVTIEGLAVTYYARDAKSKVMDTVHQHARMFGYRERLLPITRLFSPSNVLAALKDVHESDTGTREAIVKEGVMSLKPVWVGKELKPTRAGVYNPAEIRAFPPRKTLFPRDIEYKRERIASVYKRLHQLLVKYDDPKKYYPVQIDELIRILELIPSMPVPDADWEDERVRQVLKNMKLKPIEKTTGWLNVRRGEAGEGFHITRRNMQESGFAAGQQIEEARDKYPDEPVLLLRMQAGTTEDKWDNQRFYAPTLILPRGKFAFLYVAK
jgi:hypothetical protein